MLFAAGARSELSSADGRRRPIAFYDALNGDIAAYFDDKTIVAGDLDDLFSELLDQDTCHIHIPVHFEPATGDEGPVLGQTVLDLARIDTPGESQDMYTCQVSISVGSKVLHAVNGTPVRYPAVAIENGLHRISVDCERVPRCCVFCRYANYEAIGSHSTGELLCYLPRKQQYDAAMERFSQDVRVTVEQLLPLGRNLPHVSEFSTCSSYTRRPQEWGSR